MISNFFSFPFFFLAIPKQNQFIFKYYQNESYTNYAQFYGYIFSYHSINNKFILISHNFFLSSLFLHYLLRLNKQTILNYNRIGKTILRNRFEIRKCWKINVAKFTLFFLSFFLSLLPFFLFLFSIIYCYFNNFK